MSFNENDVNRDAGGKFDTKVGAPASVTLPSVEELDTEEYRLAGIRELEAWEQYVYSAHGETARTILEEYPDAERLYVEEMVNEDDGTSYFSPERIEDATGKVLWEGEKELREKLIDNTFWLSEDNFDYDNNEGPNAQAMLELHEHTMSENTMTMSQFQAIRDERLVFEQKKLAKAARAEFPDATHVIVAPQNGILDVTAICNDKETLWTNENGGNAELNRLSARFDDGDPMVKTTEDGQQYIDLPIDLFDDRTWGEGPF